MLGIMRRQPLPSIMLTVIVAVFVGFVYPFVVWGIGQVTFKHQADGSFITRGNLIVGAANIGQGFSDKDGNPLPQYFQPRPSDAGTGYNASESGASNLGPGDPRLVGFIPGFNTVNLDGNPSKTNPFATSADPYCVPMTPGSAGLPVYEPVPGDKYAKNPDGSYVCDPNTVPERALAYRQLNDLASNVAIPVDAVTASASGLDPGISVANADLQAPRVAKVRGLPLSTVTTLIEAHTIGRAWGFLGEPYVNVLELNLALDSLRR
ncbi:MAG TPA: potassium-transporting ATPase subunit C [Acidimicrobiales bacterium]|nr:potassium-transporting ATPase subunit C [Acidimicrobiales bacterium]